jgi:hypothetical protein
MVPGNNLVLKVWFGYRLIYTICNCSKKETKKGKMKALYIFVRKKPVIWDGWIT